MRGPVRWSGRAGRRCRTCEDSGKKDAQTLRRSDAQTLRRSDAQTLRRSDAQTLSPKITTRNYWNIGGFPGTRPYALACLSGVSPLRARIALPAGERTYVTKARAS